MTETIITREHNTSKMNYGVSEEAIFTPANATEVKMGLADDGLDILLDLLSDPSSDCGGYVLREAYSNAYDAIKAAGNADGRIDISVPTWGDDKSAGIAERVASNRNTAHRSLVVEDNGCGMTTEELSKCFLQYGGSNKRSNADAIGSKGLGALAPLSITDAFTVITRKDGVETRAVITRRAGGNYATVTTAETSKPDGTRIEVPVGDERTVAEMRACADKLAKYSTGCPLYIDGEKASDGVDGFVPLGKVKVANAEFDAWVDEKSFPCKVNHAGVVVTVGGFPYQLTSSGYYSGGTTVVLAIEPGYLNFNLSRDEIKRDGACDDFRFAVSAALDSYAIPQEVVTRYFEDNGISGLFENRANFGDLEVATDGSLRFRTDWVIPASVLDDADGSWSSLKDADSTCTVVEFGSQSAFAALKDEGRCYYSHYSHRATTVTRPELARLTWDKMECMTPFQAVMFDATSGKHSLEVLVTGADDDVFAFLSKRSVDVRNAVIEDLGTASTAFAYDFRFILDKENRELSHMERELLGENVAFYTQAELAELAREYAAAKRRAARKPAKKAAANAVDAIAYVYKLEGSEFSQCPRSDWGNLDWKHVAVAVGKDAVTTGRTTVLEAFRIAADARLTDKDTLVLFEASVTKPSVVKGVLAAGAELFAKSRNDIAGDATVEKAATVKWDGENTTVSFEFSKMPEDWKAANATVCRYDACRRVHTASRGGRCWAPDASALFNARSVADGELADLLAIYTALSTDAAGSWSSVGPKMPHVTSNDRVTVEIGDDGKVSDFEWLVKFFGDNGAQQLREAATDVSLPVVSTAMTAALESEWATR